MKNRIEIRLTGLDGIRTKKQQADLNRLFTRLMKIELQADDVRARISEILRAPAPKKGRHG